MPRCPLGSMKCNRLFSNDFGGHADDIDERSL